MNTREQILAKRVAALEARLQASMVVIDHLIKDLEFTESVGAAFAWDLMSEIGSNHPPCDSADYCMGEMWDEAVKALENAREATQEESGE